MNFNFELILFYAIVVSGIIALLYNIFGKATRVWMSYDTPTHPIGWNRIGEKII